MLDTHNSIFKVLSLSPKIHCTEFHPLKPEKQKSRLVPSGWR